MAGIFLPHERGSLHRGDVVERGGAVTTRYFDAASVAIKGPRSNPDTVVRSTRGGL
jgi:hypothetical protein